MTGWMSPLAVLTGLGKPKCEKMRSPRAWFFALWSVADARLALTFSAVLETLAEGSFDAASETRPAFLLGALPPAAGAWFAGLPPCGFPFTPFAEAFAAFAARCRSCSSRRSCLVLARCALDRHSRENSDLNRALTSVFVTFAEPEEPPRWEAHSEDALLRSGLVP